MIFRREVKEEPKPARRRFVYKEYYRQAQFSAASRLKSKKNICAAFAPVPKGEIRCNFHGRVTHVRLVSVFIMKKQKRAIKQKLLVSETCKLELKGKCHCFLIGGLIASDAMA